jgi:hypothetical protein
MDYKFLFIVTSSIIPFKVGSVHSPQERFEQTLNTIQSIREKVPNSIIWITESSSVELPEEYSSRLIEQSDYYVEHYDDEVLQQLYENLDKCPEKFDFGKSLLETRSLFNTFIQIQNLDFTRAFKISGRYTLNDEFDITDYESRILNNHYVAQVHTMKDDMFNLICGVAGQVTTGLWSFDKSLLNETIQMYQKCFSYMDTMMSYTGGIDIEHSIYKWIDHSKVIRVPSLGVNRNHGPSGEVYPI